VGGADTWELSSLLVPRSKPPDLVIIAYMKRRTGRKVQVECDGLKLKIDEATDEEVDRILTLVEQRHRAKRQKK
jgi:hypothetical protein